MDETQSQPEAQNNLANVFVGRQAIYARLQQQILDPPQRHALLFMGHDGMGKTSLLQNFNHVFDDTLIGVYFPLATLDLSTEDTWLTHLVEATNTRLAEYEFSMSRVAAASEADSSTPRDWLRDGYLPEILHVIRRHRRLVWLFDDAEYLLDKLPSTHLSYLHELLQTYPQLTIILTLNTKHDDRLDDFMPLVNPPDAERIHLLTETDSLELIRQLAPGVTDDAVRKIYELSGGHPRLLQRFGKALNAQWVSSSDKETVQKIVPEVYTASREEFRQVWLRFTRDERLVLTAIASLIYADATQTITSRHIEAWLVETDYPMDLVAIHAALRGLDYRDIVSHQQSGAVNLRIGLIQTWLLENARLDDNSSEKLQLRWWMLAAVVVIALLLMLVLTQLPAASLPVANTPPPTITLHP